MKTIRFRPIHVWALVLIALVAGPHARAAKAPKAGDAAPAAQKNLAGAMGGATQEHPSFSVDMIMTHDGETFTMKRTVDGGRTRMDMRAKGMETTQITLDDEAGTIYTVMPSEKRVMKQTRAGMQKTMGEHAPKAAAATAEPTAEPQGKIEKIGHETIDGRPADKYQVSYEQGSGVMWIDSERNLPLRMESQGATVAFKNYDFRPQPAELFLPPKGYEVMDMDEMMSKMKGMGMPGMGMGVGGMAGGMAKGMAGNMGGTMGGTLGGALGGALGGPIGSMVGQYVGQKIGTKLGTAAAGAVLPGK